MYDCLDHNLTRHREKSGNNADLKHEETRRRVMIQIFPVSLSLSAALGTKLRVDQCEYGGKDMRCGERSGGSSRSID